MSGTFTCTHARWFAWCGHERNRRPFKYWMHDVIFTQEISSCSTRAGIKLLLSYIVLAYHKVGKFGREKAWWIYSFLVFGKKSLANYRSVKSLLILSTIWMVLVWQMLTIYLFCQAFPTPNIPAIWYLMIHIYNETKNQITQ